MILEESDIIEYLRDCDNDDIVKFILDSTQNFTQDAEIAESLADTCQQYLTRYELIDKEA